MTTPSNDPSARHLGRYVLYDEIARGGMGAVHVGRLLGPAGFKKLVAIKRVVPLFASDPETVRRFQAEAALSARILHPSVVSTLDVVAEQGELFLVMEFVRGESLARLLASANGRQERVPVPEAAAIMTSVLAGLHAAHEATDEEGRHLGLVHCDVSPQNVLVGVEGLARIADFGIARSRLEPVSEDGGRVRGKARYLAPEQLDYDTSRIDRRADIFAAAALLWETLAGRPLFEGDDTAEIIEKILAAKVPSLRAERTDVPLALDEALARALERDPERRHATAAELAEAIEACGVGLATPRATGAWVSAMVGPRLEQLDTIVRHVERAGAPSTVTFDSPDAPTITIDRRATEGLAPAGPKPDEASPTRTFTVDVPNPAAHATAITQVVPPSPGRPKNRRPLGAIGAAVAVVLAVGLFVASSYVPDRGANIGRRLAAPALAPLPLEQARAAESAGALPAPPAPTVEPKQEGTSKQTTATHGAPPRKPSSPPRPTESARPEKPYVADRP